MSTVIQMFEKFILKNKIKQLDAEDSVGLDGF